MNIALICANKSPIPATKGGATETMMTHLLEVNEEYLSHHFSIFSYFDNDAQVESTKYKGSSFYFYHPNHIFDRFESLGWRLLRKISGEKIYLHSQFIRWCSAIINKSNIDVIVVEGNCFQVQQLRKLLPNKVIILHMHIDRINKELKASKDIINASNGLIAISQFCKERMKEVDLICEQKVIVVKNTIDTDKFQYKGDEEKIKVRRKLGIKDTQKVISYCGRIDETKGVLELVEAIKSLNDPNLHLLIIGSSAYLGSGKNEYVSTVEEESSRVIGGVTFTGYIPQMDLPCYISAADIAVVPSIWLEAAGNVTIEALSCGVPVVASMQGGIPEYADVKACRLVKYDAQFKNNLANEIHQLAYNNELYYHLKSHAREIALKYDKHNYYNHYCNALKHFLDR